MEELSIGQICSRFSSGRNIKAANIHESGLYPVYGSNGLRGFTDSYNYDGECAIVGRQGAYCGNVKYVSGKSYMSEHAIVAKTNPNHNNKYFAYKLSLAKLGRFSGQAAQPGLSVTKLLRLKFEMPSKQYQDRIASILSAYDSLIENNTKRIRLLEKMAENLYKEWFVRFRFPGYEKVEIKNGLPKGWKHGKLGDIVEFLNGFAFKSQTFCAEGKYSIVTIKNVRSDGFEGNNTDKVLELPSRIPKHCLLKEGDILLSLTGNIGRVCRVLGNGYLLNQRVAKLKSKNPLFCYCTFKSDYIYQSLNVISYGTAQLNLSPVKASKIKLPIPLLELLNNFEQIVKPIFAEIDTLLHQNTLLARRRDLLLPRLMSGKLEVKP